MVRNFLFERSSSYSVSYFALLIHRQTESKCTACFIRVAESLPIPLQRLHSEVRWVGSPISFFFPLCLESYSQHD